MHVVHTVGHSTRSAEELIALLQAFDVRLVVDVRRFPGSRRHPQFSGERLAATLRAADIDYVHEESLGGRRPVLEDSPNDAWRNRGFRGYADYMGTRGFRAALERLRGLAAERPLAILCAEAVPWLCHRNLIADALVAGGVEVHHILAEDGAELHQLNAHARLSPDGALVYGKGRPQLELLD